MGDEHKTKERLIDEIGALRRRVAQLEEAEASRTRIEEELLESREHYRSLVEGSPN